VEVKCTMLHDFFHFYLVSLVYLEELNVKVNTVNTDCDTISWDLRGLFLP